MSHSIPERDWKVYRDLRPVLLNRFCERVLHDLVKAAQAAQETPHERYLKIYGQVREQDKLLGAIFDGLSRSRAFDQLIYVRRLKLITEEEFQRFNEETRRQIDSIIEW